MYDEYFSKAHQKRSSGHRKMKQEPPVIDVSLVRRLIASQFPD